MEIARFSRDAQRSFVELAESLSDDDWATTVPCTPAWTVRDVLSHVCGLTDDVANGRVEGAATDPWTAAQVERWTDGWPGRPLTITFDDGAAVSLAGDGTPNELRGISRFDIVRCRLGRRSRRQVAEWSWRAAPSDTELDAWFAFGPSELPIHE